MAKAFPTDNPFLRGYYGPVNTEADAAHLHDHRRDAEGTSAARSTATAPIRNSRRAGRTTGSAATA